MVERQCNMCKKSKGVTDYAAVQWDRGELRICIKCKLNERNSKKRGKGGQQLPSKYDLIQEEEARAAEEALKQDSARSEANAKGKGSGKGPSGLSTGGKGGRGPKPSWREQEAAKAAARQQAKEEEVAAEEAARAAKHAENDERRDKAVAGFMGIDKLSYELCMAARAGDEDGVDNCIDAGADVDFIPAVAIAAAGNFTEPSHS